MSDDSEEIRYEDLADPGAFDKFQKNFSDTQFFVESLDAAIVELAKNTKDVLVNFKGSASTVEDLKKVNTEIKNSNDLILLNEKYKKLQAQSNAALSAQRKAEINEKKAQLDLDNKIAKGTEAQEKANKKSQSAWAQLNAELRKSNEIARELEARKIKGIALTEQETATLKTAHAENLRLDTAIKQVEYSLGNAQRNVGNYNGQLGTLAKSVKGFGALGRIFSRLLGIDPEVFNGIREAGMALRDIQHISEGTKLAKEGETVATEAHTVALGEETTAQEAEAVATGLSTGGIILLVGALVGASIAIYEYISAKKEQKEIDEAVAKIDKELAEQTSERRKLDAENSKRSAEAILEKLVIGKKLTEEQKKEILLNNDAALASKLRSNAELKELRDLETAYIKYGIKVNETGKTIQKARERLEDNPKNPGVPVYAPDVNTDYTKRLAEFEKEASKIRLQAELDRNAITAGLNISKQEAENEAAKKRQELEDSALKKLSEIERKAGDEFLKDQSKTNAAKVDLDYQLAVREIDELKISEGKKAKARIALKKEFNAKYNEALEKDAEDEFKKAQDLAKKQSDENAKQAEKDFNTTTAKLNEQESAEILAIEKNYAKQKDHSIKAEEKKQKAIDAVKLKYLLIEQLRNEDDPKKKAEIQKQINDLEIAAIERGNKEKAKALEEWRKERKKIEDDITDGVKDGLKTRSDLRQQADQFDIEQQKLNIETQTKLAAAGKGNNLADAQAKYAQAQEKKLQDAKKAERVQADIAVVQTFINALDSGKPIFEALGEAGAVKAIIAQLVSGSAYEGLEDTGTVGNPLDKNGGRIMMLHNNEGIVNAEGKSEVPGLVTAINKDGLQGVQDWAFENIYRQQFDAANVSTTYIKESSHDEMLANRLEKKFDLLQKAIESKPTQRIEVDGLKGVIEEVREGNMTRRTNYKLSNQRRSLRENG